MSDARRESLRAELRREAEELEADRTSRDEFEAGLHRAMQAEQDRFRRNMERFGAQEDEQQRIRDRDAAS